MKDAVEYCAFFNISKHTEYNFLSNFHPCSVVSPEYGAFRCSEGLYHYQKFKHLNDAQVHLQFREASGQQAWDLSRRLAVNISPQWDRIVAMKKTLICKFADGNLKKSLLGTASAYLVENSTCGHDAFWSDNGDGTGQNKLGIMLMELRGDLGGVGIVPCPEILKTFYKKTCKCCSNCCHFTNDSISYDYCDTHKVFDLQSKTQGTSTPFLNTSMQVLGGFIAAIGISAVAVAFVALNAATFGLAGLIVAGLGSAALLGGFGLFAAGTYKKYQYMSDVGLDDSLASVPM